MGIFKKGEVLGSGTTPGRYKIRITTEDGETLFVSSGKGTGTVPPVSYTHLTLPTILLV